MLVPASDMQSMQRASLSQCHEGKVLSVLNNWDVSLSLGKTLNQGYKLHLDTDHVLFLPYVCEYDLFFSFVSDW